MNCWTLDSEIDVHVCNDSKRIQMNRLIESNDELMTEKTVYSIERYETMNIIVKNSNESVNIQLVNVALISEFFTNLMCLRKFLAKEIHWNIEKKRLHHKKKIFCYVELVENHWVLEKNFSTDQIFETFEAKSEESKSDLVITRREWHEILKHFESKTISHLKDEMNEVKIDDLESVSLINQCETCVFIKRHHLMSRRID
jgi:tRNA G10  N-methylase Trm11